MDFPEGAKLIWFGRNRQMDRKYLQAWRHSPLTYTKQTALDSFWNADRYEIFLGNDPDGDLFQRASQLLMTNQFYPPEVMASVSDYSLQERRVRLGDRILQRIKIFQIRQHPLLEALTVNEITEVVEEPRRVGFTYTTTRTHSEVGEWSPAIDWRADNDVVLVIQVLSRIQPNTSLLIHRFTRKFQLRAHRISIRHFVRLLFNRSATIRKAPFSTDLFPAGLLTMAVLFLLLALLGVNRQTP